MAAVKQVEILPKGDEWNWQERLDSGRIGEKGEGYETRREAIDAGREAAGAERIEVKRGGSDVAESYLTSTTTRVVLLKRDGSEHGELNPPVGEGGPGQTVQVNLTPATEASEADRG